MTEIQNKEVNDSMYYLLIHTQVYENNTREWKGRGRAPKNWVMKPNKIHAIQEFEKEPDYDWCRAMLQEHLPLVSYSNNTYRESVLTFEVSESLPDNAVVHFDYKEPKPKAKAKAKAKPRAKKAKAKKKD